MTNDPQINSMPLAEDQIMSTMYLGCDPGAGGALALYSPELDHIVFHDMPVFRVPRGKTVKREVDGYKLGALIGEMAPKIKRAYVELVGGMPGQGGQFQFGLNTGVVHGVLYAHQIPIQFVPPAKWKLALGLRRVAGMTKAQLKDESRKRASLLWPHHAAEFARVKDDGRAEAALLAFFGASQ